MKQLFWAILLLSTQLVHGNDTDDTSDKLKLMTFSTKQCLKGKEYSGSSLEVEKCIEWVFDNITEMSSFEFLKRSCFIISKGTLNEPRAEIFIPCMRSGFELINAESTIIENFESYIAKFSDCDDVLNTNILWDYYFDEKVTAY